MKALQAHTPRTASAAKRSADRPKLASTFTLSGCRPFPLPAAEMADYDGRYEYWEAGVGWELRDVSPKHEQPRSRLVELIGDIAKMRGTPIAMFGTADLQERDADGSRVRAAEADDLIYLDGPESLPDVFVIGVHPLPDVVFEVDLTTDIRNRKLDVYASWGVPELWVEVPDAHMASKRKRSGLTIYVLHAQDGCFREQAESVAFPTLSAQEIHAAVNSPFTTERTVRAARRVGRILGRRAGTGPDNDPFLGADRRRSRLTGWREGRTRGIEEGLAEGREEGLAEGRLAERVSMLENLLRARGIPVGSQLAENADRIAALPHDAVVQTALESADLDEFLHRLRGSRS